MTSFRSTGTKGCFATLIVLALASRSIAHPLAQGRVEVIVFPDRISLWARVSVEQVIVQQLLPTRDDAKVDTPSECYRKHSDYLIEHLTVTVDGKKLKGKIVSVSEPDQKSLYPQDAERQFVTYEFEYALSSPPTLVELSQNVLNEVDFAPGNRWEATYVTGIRQDQKQGLDNLLLTSQGGVPFSCDWTAPKKEAVPVAAAPATKTEAPKRLNEPVEAPRDNVRFVLGLIAGIAIVYFLAMLVRRSNRSKNPQA